MSQRDIARTFDVSEPTVGKWVKDRLGVTGRTLQGKLSQELTDEIRSNLARIPTRNPEQSRVYKKIYRLCLEKLPKTLLEGYTPLSPPPSQSIHVSPSEEDFSYKTETSSGTFYDLRPQPNTNYEESTTRDEDESETPPSSSEQFSSQTRSSSDSLYETETESEISASSSRQPSPPPPSPIPTPLRIKRESDCISEVCNPLSEQAKRLRFFNDGRHEKSLAATPDGLVLDISNLDGPTLMSEVCKPLSEQAKRLRFFNDRRHEKSLAAAPDGLDISNLGGPTLMDERSPSTCAQEIPWHKL